MDISDKQKGAYIFILILVYSIAIYIYANRSAPSIIKSILMQPDTKTTSVKVVDRILIMYVWAESDVQSLGNLQFFVRYGVNALQPADYYFILQKMDKKPVNESRLPLLPPNAHYIQHDNECYDIGTFGWFLSQNIANTTLYKYFFFMNSSVRGPFFVPYFETEAIWWFHIFTKRLTDEIKLVGSTISCAARPHIQSYLMATDRVGFALLNGNQSTVFQCHGGYDIAIRNGEIAASTLFLQANYQIASLQSKYQGWDFRKKESVDCNNGASPIFFDKAVDGISHDPYELIFVKFKGKAPFDTELERRALVYQKWLDERSRKSETNATKT